MSNMLQELKMLHKTLRRGQLEREEAQLASNNNNTTVDPDATDIEEEMGQEYDVDAVLGKMFDENENQFYLIRWKNWDGEPTWEPEENCSECFQLIKDFEERFERKRRSKEDVHQVVKEDDEEEEPVNVSQKPRTTRRYSKPTSARKPRASLRLRNAKRGV